MQFLHTLLCSLFILSFVAASPVDRFKLDKRQDNVIVVTVTDSLTVTVSSTMSQSTTTITVVAGFGQAVNQPGVTTTITDDVSDDSDPPATVAPAATTPAAPVAPDTPAAAAVDPPTTTSSDPPAATTPSTSGSTDTSSDGTMYTGQGTFYAPGEGACGIDNTATDYICAIGHALFDSLPDGGNPNNSPWCGRQIRAFDASGSSVVVTVTDRCAGCAEYDLDFSPIAFDELAPESEGRIPITWEFIS